MPNGKNIGKIYSRKRFVIKNLNFGTNPSLSQGSSSDSDSSSGANPDLRIDLKLKQGSTLNPTSSFENEARKKKGTKKKTFKFVILMILIIIAFRLFCSYLEPIFQTLCEDKVKSLATLITNQQSTTIMNKYQYDQLYTIEKDESSDIVVVRANIVPINNLISDLTGNIQREFDELNNIKISMPLGSLTGIYFISGFGPRIPINVSVAGTVETNIKSEFIAQGINQTLHRVYVDFDCDMKIVTPVKNFSQNVTNQVIIAEHVIVGNIPSSYYNLEGFENKNETMQVIK